MSASITVPNTVPNLSAFTAEQVADWYFLTRIAATDSASAGTAMSTGYKTVDGNIAWLPGDLPDGALTTIAETLRDEKGYAIGVVSTVPFSHATPAAFVSHNVNRNNYTQIANEIIYTVQPEVVIGGGNRNWGGNYLSAADQAALENGTTAYTYVGRQAGVDGGDALIAAANITDANNDGQLDGKLFGLFGGIGGNFDYHQAGNDTLTGDNQSGGKGSDTFVLAVGEGTDTITDFQVGIDKIGLAGILTFGQLQRTGNTIGYNGEMLVILTGVDTTMLTEASFVPVI